MQHRSQTEMEKSCNIHKKGSTYSSARDQSKFPYFSIASSLYPNFFVWSVSLYRVPYKN